MKWAFFQVHSRLSSQPSDQITYLDWAAFFTHSPVMADDMGGLYIRTYHYIPQKLNPRWPAKHSLSTHLIYVQLPFTQHMGSSSLEGTMY